MDIKTGNGLPTQATQLLLVEDNEAHVEFICRAFELQNPVVIMTSYGDEHVAVEAMKAGALDYVVKSEATLADMPYIAERALHDGKKGLSAIRWMNGCAGFILVSEGLFQKHQ